MVHITCDCGSDTWHINWYPPMNADAICTECENEVGIGTEAMKA